MTNGEKILTAFPNATTRIYKNKGFTYIVVEQDDKWIADFDMEWWNTEYKEPTTKNDLPHCQCTDAEIAKSFIEDVEAVKDQLPCGEQMDFPSTFDEFAKDYGFKDKDEVYTNGSELIPVFRVKQWLEHISTTKNDLAVDCIDRQATLDAIIKRLGIKNEKYLLEAERAIYQQILAMPSVIPQLSSELEKNSKKLEKNFGELDCISRADAIRVASGYCHPSNVAKELVKLPSVTTTRPKGHWIEHPHEAGANWEYSRYECSECHEWEEDDSDYCPSCGADMRASEV